MSRGFLPAIIIMQSVSFPIPSGSRSLGDRRASALWHPSPHQVLAHLESVQTLVVIVPELWSVVVDVHDEESLADLRRETVRDLDRVPGGGWSRHGPEARRGCVGRLNEDRVVGMAERRVFLI
mmetsp:Transcript_11945/g.33706  ORF Transcript_11945/g.33706 Transcript_11945/m.33706 type:complete len:123 (+) Transcript_11945:818-1186(+)